MNIKKILLIFLSINTLKMLKKDSPIFLQNINMIAYQLFMLFKKSTTFWDNPRIYSYIQQCFFNHNTAYTHSTDVCHHLWQNTKMGGGGGATKLTPYLKKTVNS